MKVAITKILSIFIIVCTVACFFSACDETEPNPTSAVCILYGNTRNVSPPNKESLKEEIVQMAEKVTNCSMIIIDGDADSVCYKSTIGYPASLLIDRESNNNEYINQVINDISLCRPQKEEIDIISALYNAGKFFSEEKNLKDKKLLIYSSGISTAGTLNFSENPELIKEDPSVIVKMLKKSKSLPTLKGVSVEWHGFGVVEEPQEKLSKINEHRLKNIWEAILAACGVDMKSTPIEFEVKSVGDYDIEKAKEKYPKVSVVDFSEREEIDETKVEFSGDSAEFKDKEKARKILKPYADLILESGCTNFYLIGSTASVREKDFCMDLSEKRAEAVKKVLCSYGVPSSFFEIYGMGREEGFITEAGWRVNDLKSDESLNGLAPKNRKVIIVEKNSAEGKDFIKTWNKVMNSK